jgi:hypothetical protein
MERRRDHALLKEETMSDTTLTTTQSRWGTVTTEGADGAGPPNVGNATLPVTRYHWWPSAEIASDMPADFTLTLACVTGPRGIRRFWPVEGFPALITQAYLPALAILSKIRGLSKEERFGYRLMAMLFQQAPWLREHLDRAFTGLEDFRLTPAVRLDQRDRDVLPEDLGLDARGEGRRWRLDDLLEQGRQAADWAGAGPADTERLLRLGLWAAARRNPLAPAALTPEELRSVVRQGFFDPGPATGVRKRVELKERVQHRLLRALERHIDDPPDRFERWFFRNVDSIVGQVAKQKKCGGPIPREQVRQMLLESVVDSWDYLGGCLCLAMQAFVQALPTPLSGPERAAFAALYYGQDYLGGLPLALLHARFTFLREAILALLERPDDPDVQGALLRLLVYYGELCTKRRGGDRAYKRQRHHRQPGGRGARVLVLDPERDTAPQAEADLFQQIAAEHRERRQAACGCGTLQPWRARLVEEKTRERLIVLEDVCGTCGHREEVTLSRQQFEMIGRELTSSGYDFDS